MGAETDGLQHAADGPRLHELASAHGGLVLEAFGVEDREDALGLGLDAPSLGQLLERRCPGFVHQEVLAVLHDANAQRCTLVRDAGAHHELERRVLEDLALAPRLPDVGVALGELLSQLGFLGVERDELAASAHDGAHLTIDVTVIDTHDAEADARPVLGRRDGPGCDRLGPCGAASLLGEGCSDGDGGEAGHSLQELPPWIGVVVHGAPPIKVSQS